MIRLWMRAALAVIAGGAIAVAQESSRPDAEQAQHSAGPTPAAASSSEPTADPPADEHPDAATPEGEPDHLFSPFELQDYSGDLWTRSTLSGDWGGLRTQLNEKGLTFKLDVTQVMQGNAHGGASTNNGLRYSGVADYEIWLDTGRMNLWPGGRWTIHAETQFGSSVNRLAGSVMAPNFDALLPTPDEGKTTLSEVFLTQPLSKQFVFIAGKMDPTRFADKNTFANSSTTQFMNAAFMSNPVVFPFAPYTSLGAFAVFMPSEMFTLAAGVMNTNDSASRTGFDTGFHSPEGWTAAVELGLNIKPFGLPGHQRAGYVYSNKNFFLLGQDRRVGLPAVGLLNTLLIQVGALNPKTRSDDFTVYYNFDQYLYTEKEDPTQGVGLFGRFGWSTGESNPIAAFYSLGMGGKGVIPERDEDTFGLGYYYVDFSDNIGSFVDLNAEQGVELFYNIEITPWLHITPDLQVIVNPGSSGNDVALVYGLRMQMSF